VDFKKACKFYITNYKLLNDPIKARALISESYNLLRYKRSKLKSGTTIFVFKQLYYGEWLVSQWFEMEFTSRKGPHNLRKGVEETLAVLDWSWDFKNLLLLGLIFLTGFNHITSHLESYYTVFIAGGFEENVVRVGLNCIFRMAELRALTPPRHVIYSLTSELIDVALVFDLF